jgi:hypothetical protein
LVAVEVMPVDDRSVFSRTDFSAPDEGARQDHAGGAPAKQRAWHKNFRIAFTLFFCLFPASADRLAKPHSIQSSRLCPAT